MKRFLLGLCAITLLPWSVVASPMPDRCTLLVLGDSLSAAFGMSTQEGWVYLLNIQLMQRGYGCTVINASISGDTTQGGRVRLPALLQKHHPTHILIELGANNGLRALPVDAMRRDLAWMIETILDSDARLLLLGMQMPPNYGPVYTAQFAAVYQELAKKYTVPLVPFLLENVISRPEWMQADAMHPNAKGQAAILQNVWPKLEMIIRISKHE